MAPRSTAPRSMMTAYAMGMAVPASAVVLDEDKDGVEPMGARYTEAVQTST
jgi:hypothetical protein